MILQLNPPIPVTTPKGPALAHFIIDDGIEHDIKWVCFQDGNGESWTFSNPDVRAQKNLTQGREYISPFYNPEDVALPKQETALQKRLKEAKRMMETPNFEDLVKDANSIANGSHQKNLQDKISEIASEMRGNELKIVDDFCKAYHAALSHMTGKEFIQIIDEITLNVQQFFKDGQMGTRYWFSPKEKNDG
jgi:hypothetical protein